MNLTTGGLSIFVVALVWFLVFIPSRINRSGQLKSREKNKKAKSQSKAKRRSVTIPQTMPAKEIPDVNPYAFKPNDVPSQSFLKTGSIEIVNLADVIDIEQAKRESDIDNIDEILRRRRHHG